MSLSFDTFVNPPKQFRSVPFWSLNDVLDPAEIRRQMEAFGQGGFGGAYLHSRIGLLTKYLGDDWWAAMDAGVRAAGELDLEAWFYDEDKWPSGFAGGIVPLQSEDYHARCLLRLDKAQAVPQTGEVLAEDDTYRYVCYKMRMGNPWHNGTCWVDLMNPRQVQAFIECSYKPYAKRYAADFGHAALGIFTDEPQISRATDRVSNAGAVSYSPVVRQAFKARCGYQRHRPRRQPLRGRGGLSQGPPGLLPHRGGLLRGELQPADRPILRPDGHDLDRPLQRRGDAALP